MLLAMSHHQANERVIAGGAATATATATGAADEFHIGSPMLVHAGRLMTRALPFIFVMVNQ